MVAALPEESHNKARLTTWMVDDLWSKLKHPPLSYLGDKFQYRTPDGSYNVGAWAHLILNWLFIKILNRASSRLCLVKQALHMPNLWPAVLRFMVQNLIQATSSIVRTIETWTTFSTDTKVSVDGSRREQVFRKSKGII